MSAKLPELIDPVLLAERRSVLSGAIKIATLERLSDLVAESNGDVHTELIFSKVGKRVLVSGTIKTTLQIICQSCLQAMPWPLDLAFKLGVVSSSQEAEQLEIDCEPLQYNGEKISLSAIIEDEILLALPDFPKHGYECLANTRSKNRDYDEQINQIQKVNPFSVLAKLKNTGDKNGSTEE